MPRYSRTCPYTDATMFPLIFPESSVTTVGSCAPHAAAAASHQNRAHRGEVRHVIGVLHGAKMLILPWSHVTDAEHARSHRSSQQDLARSSHRSSLDPRNDPRSIGARAGSNNGAEEGAGGAVLHYRLRI